jgi:hypothetical protein
MTQLQLDTHDLSLISQILANAGGPSGDVYTLERNDSKHTGIMHKTNNAQ